METTQLWMDLETAVVELLEAGEDPGEIVETVDGHCESFGQEDNVVRRPKPKRNSASS